MATYDSIFTADDALEGQPFLIPDLYRSSALALDPALGTTLFPLPDAGAQETKKPGFPPPPPADTLFKLPAEFSEYQSASFAESFSSDAVTEDDSRLFSSVAGGLETDVGEEGDMWLDPRTSVPPEKGKFYTWDSFLIGEHGNAGGNGFVSEAGPGVVDAALQEHGEEGFAVRAEVVCTCLLHMGLGRSSVLFLWDGTKSEFRPVREGIRVLGATAGTVGNVVETFAHCGKGIKMLERFVDGVYRESSSASPAKIALAQCTSTITESIQIRLSAAHRSIRSILHLHSLIREPALIVDSFERLTLASRGAMDDCELLSRLFDVVQQQQHRSGWLRPLLVETLARVGRPWLESVEQWIGLSPGPAGVGVGEMVPKGQFVSVEEVIQMDETGKQNVMKNYTFDTSKIPSFINAESAETVFETGRSLRYLEKFHPKHPLSIPATLRDTNAPRLQWKFSWQDLEDLQQQAKTYERTLRAEIHKYTLRQAESVASEDAAEETMDIDSAFETFGRSKSEIATHLASTVETMSHTLPSLDSPASSDPLATMVQQLTRLPLSDLTAFEPPLSITPLLSFSHIITAQSRVTNISCLHMFIHEHSLGAHLSLLRRFYLFGDSSFTYRLSRALFSLSADTTERRVGETRSGGIMGLKLGSRKNWPPASSELRLALMDVLTTSLSSSTGLHSGSKTGDLPGGLSFAVREMNAKEVDNIMSVDNIQALDFLKLDYRTPAPLDAVITRNTLRILDRIFTFLLRLLRMLYVVNQLWLDCGCSFSAVSCPEASFFAFEARHFVSTVASYVRSTAIGATWRRFEEKMEGITQGRGNSGEGVEDVRRYFESTLERMAFATMCRRRQDQIMGILEECFGKVLSFARLLRERNKKFADADTGNLRRRRRRRGGRSGGVRGDGGVEDEEEEGGDPDLAEIMKLRRSFRRRVGIFLRVCRGLSERRVDGDGGKDVEGRRAADAVFGTSYKEEANMLGMLLVSLEVTGYYSQSV